MNRIPRWATQAGATAVEYALIVAAIAAIIVLVVNVIGRQTQGSFCDASSAMETAGAQNNPNC